MGEREGRATRVAPVAVMAFSPTLCPSYTVGHYLDLVNPGEEKNWVSKNILTTMAH
jgi:hypothetical protein